MMDIPPLPSAQIIDNTENSWCEHLVPAGCIKCGQAHLISKDLIGKICPNCCEGTMESQPVRLRKEEPEYIIPFKKTKEHVKPVIENFTKGIRLKPDDFNPDKMMERLVPLYIPMWLIDSDMRGTWKAAAGFDYQVKSSLENYDGGKWSTTEVVRTNIRWEPRTGEICRHYDNITLPATGNHKRFINMTGDCDFKDSLPYSHDHKVEGTVRIPDLMPENIWDEAKNSIDNGASEECRVASGCQHIRNFTFTGNYEKLNWTQFFLPLYFTYYKDDKGKCHGVYINGQTGAMGGIRLASQKKAWLWGAGLFLTGIIMSILGLLVFLGGTLFAPLALVGAFIIFISFIPCIGAIFPVIFTWQWNKKQKEEMFKG